MFLFKSLFIIKRFNEAEVECNTRNSKTVSAEVALQMGDYFVIILRTLYLSKISQSPILSPER